MCSDVVYVFYFVSYVFLQYFACDLYFAFRDVVFVCVKNDVCADNVCSVYISWWLKVKESCLNVYS